MIINIGSPFDFGLLAPQHPCSTVRYSIFSFGVRTRSCHKLINILILQKSISILQAGGARGGVSSANCNACSDVLRSTRDQALARQPTIFILPNWILSLCALTTYPGSVTTISSNGKPGSARGRPHPVTTIERTLRSEVPRSTRDQAVVGGHVCSLFPRIPHGHQHFYPSHLPFLSSPPLPSFSIRSRLIPVVPTFPWHLIPLVPAGSIQCVGKTRFCL
ncbi:hypothetical protein R3P38DRAFT_249393 [Favolaschia claudopus]|uniref:Uncharacterized protein n=1 Tax=Favolaschia claudopus TaxID=2862362 RepID=A0AAW0CZ60_9AGAR